MAALHYGYFDGRSEGYRTGWQQGYRLGRSDAILRNIPVEQPDIRDAHVLYVPEGSPGFFAIDEGIKDALARTVRKLTIAPRPNKLSEFAARDRPDLVLVLNGIHGFPVDQVDQVRDMGIKTAVWFADDPYFTDMTVHLAPHYDYVFTHELGCVSFYREIGCEHVHYLPFAGTVHVFHPKAVDTSRQTDICFIGMPFWNRVDYFDRIAKYLSHKKVIIAGGFWNHRLTNYNLLKDKIRLEGIPPQETVDYYNGAKIVINLHRAYDTPDNPNSRKIPGLSINPRTYEICASGAFQLTDVREDLPHFYSPGYDIATFVSPEDLVEKLEYYLLHEDERREIALRGLETTWRRHTYPKRLSVLLDVVFRGTYDANVQLQLAGGEAK